MLENDTLTTLYLYLFALTKHQGTHVAGTIAAINNSIGVVGVAAGAPVVAVRVLDRRGSGSISGVNKGVDYVAQNCVSSDVANMSLGGSYYKPLNDAVIAASGKCPFFIAAGTASLRGL